MDIGVNVFMWVSQWVSQCVPVLGCRCVGCQCACVCALWRHNLSSTPPKQPQMWLSQCVCGCHNVCVWLSQCVCVVVSVCVCVCVGRLYVCVHCACAYIVQGCVLCPHVCTCLASVCMHLSICTCLVCLSVCVSKPQTPVECSHRNMYESEGGREREVQL